jgi:hypothetical protein
MYLKIKNKNKKIIIIIIICSIYSFEKINVIIITKKKLLMNDFLFFVYIQSKKIKKL